MLPRNDGINAPGNGAPRDDVRDPYVRISQVKPPIAIKRFLKLALNLIHALNQLHAKGSMHGAINPNTVFFDPFTDEVTLTGIGHGIAPPEQILPYLAPEQTSRWNHEPDHRADFYAAGLLFYWLLTGRLPFKTSEASGILHWHIAGSATPPHRINPSVPEPLSRIVVKMVSKPPEDRYQDASGLVEDLGACLSGLGKEPLGSGTEPGAAGPGAQAHDHARFVGRTAELEQLIAAFDRVMVNGCELLLLSGDSGTGKTFLAHEFRKHVADRRGLFIEGKFQQDQTGRPYTGWIKACESLVAALNLGNEADLALWRRVILTSKGNAGRMLAGLIPDLALVTGQRQETVLPPSTDTHNRLNYCFLELIRAISSHVPLVIFLDDLQWMDVASLKLLRHIINSSLLQVLVVGAHQGMDAWDDPSSAGLFQDLQKNDARTHSMTLDNLSREDMAELVRGIFALDPEDLETVGEDVFRSSDGNPLYAMRLLNVLTLNNSLRFDSFDRKWRMGVKRLPDYHFAGNITELVQHEFQLLGGDTAQVAFYASCLGQEFHASMLGSVLQVPDDVLVYALGEMVDCGLLAVVSSGEYRFAHDQIHRAAYLLGSETERSSTHLRIGRYFMDRMDASDESGFVFFVVNQLYRGTLQSIDERERLQLADLGLQAAMAAKKKCAFQSAFDYIEKTKQLLPADSWETRGHFTRTLFHESARLAYLCGLFDQSRSIANLVLEKGGTTIGNIDMMELLMDIESALLHTREAISQGFSILDMLGVPLETRPPESLHPEELLSLPPMSDPNALAAMPILSKCVPAAYQLDAHLLNSIVYTMVKMTSRYGHDINSGFAYVMYGLILSGSPDKVEAGFRFGELGVKLLGRQANKSLECRIKHIFYSHISFTKLPLATIICPMHDAAQSGLAHGDFEFVSYLENVKCCCFLFCGPTLKAVLSEFDGTLALLRSLKIEHGIIFCSIFRQMAMNLAGNPPAPLTLDGPEFREAETLQKIQEADQRNLMAYYHLAKMILAFFIEDYGSAFAHARTICDRKYDEQLRSLHLEIIYKFYFSMAYYRQHPRLEPEETGKYQPIVEGHGRHIQQLSTFCPANYECLKSILEGERAMLQGKVLESLDSLDHACRVANKHRQPLFEALAYESLSSHLTALGMDSLAQNAIRTSLSLYGAWGAELKVQELIKRNPLLTPIRKVIAEEQVIPDSVDVSTIIKATYAISAEKELDQLLAVILKMVMETSGACRGFLLIRNGGTLRIAAKGEIRNDVIVTDVCNPTRMINNAELPDTVLEYVSNTSSTVLLDNASASGDFISDSYIHESSAKSLLCIPLSVRGRQTGLLYLDNNLITSAFTQDQAVLLEQISSQAAISLENALLLKQLQRSQMLQNRAEKIGRTGGWEMDLDTMVLTWTDNVYDIHELQEKGGITFEESLGLYSSDSAPRLLEAVHQAMANGEPFEMEASLVTAGGARKFLHIIGEVDPADHKLLGSIQDITERKKTDDEIQKLKNLLSDIVDSMPSMLIGLDEHGQVTLWNRQAAVFTGISSEQACGQGLEAILPEFSQWIARLRADVMDGNRSGSVHNLSLDRLEERRYFDLVVYPLEKGISKATAVRIEDVTERKRMELELESHKEHLEHLVEDRTAALDTTIRELAVAKEHAESANRAKSAFLASMSHELRTPLNAVLGYAQLLQREDNLNEKQKNWLNTINSSGEHLLNLINDVLEISKIEAGRTVLEEGQLALHDLLLEIQDMLGAKAEAKGLRFVLQLDDDVPDLIITDGKKLRQILINLLINALKFTQSGSIRMRAFLDGSDTLCIDVSDTGIGIAPDELDSVFRRFEQTESGRTAGTGTGLGMAISREYARLMGGEITVESEVGKGTLFHVRLRCRRPGSAAPTLRSHPRKVIGLKSGQKKPRLLVVDDQENNRAVLTDLLRILGCEVATAASGAEALRVVAEFQPDLVWMDIRMPGMDGMAATRTIKSMVPGPPPKVIAITASALRDEEGPILESGCDGIVYKPFRENEIFGTLASQLDLAYDYEP